MAFQHWAGFAHVRNKTAPRYVVVQKGYEGGGALPPAFPLTECWLAGWRLAYGCEFSLGTKLNEGGQ